MDENAAFKAYLRVLGWFILMAVIIGYIFNAEMTKEILQVAYEGSRFMLLEIWRQMPWS